jgi:hypothetical protein
MSAVTAVPIRPIARFSLVKLWLGLALLLLAAAGLAWMGTRAWQVQTLESGARYRVVREGRGPAVTPQDVFALNYKLHINGLDAPVAEDSAQQNQGQPFVATTSEIYPGFGEALQHMRAGGRYVLWLPPGTHVTGALPPRAPFRVSDTLVFEVELLQIAPGMAMARQAQLMQQLQQQMQMQQGGAPHGGGVPPGVELPPGVEPAPPAGGPPPPGARR